MCHGECGFPRNARLRPPALPPRLGLVLLSEDCLRSLDFTYQTDHPAYKLTSFFVAEALGSENHPQLGYYTPCLRCAAEFAKICEEFLPSPIRPPLHLGDHFEIPFPAHRPHHLISINEHLPASLATSSPPFQSSIPLAFPIRHIERVRGLNEKEGSGRSTVWRFRLWDGIGYCGRG